MTQEIKRNFISLIREAGLIPSPQERTEALGEIIDKLPINFLACQATRKCIEEARGIVDIEDYLYQSAKAHAL